MSPLSLSLSLFTAAKRSAKGRGIQLLLRVLQEINASSLACRRVNLQKVLGLRKKMDAIYSREYTDSRLLHSPHLQSLVELVAVARLVGDEIHKSEKAEKENEGEKGRSKKDKGKERVDERQKEDVAEEAVPEDQMYKGDVSALGLRIRKAIYGDLSKRRTCKDVTKETQELVNSYGGSYLWLPSNHQTAIPFLAKAFGLPVANQEPPIEIPIATKESRTETPITNTTPSQPSSEPIAIAITGESSDSSDIPVGSPQGLFGAEQHSSSPSRSASFSAPSNRQLKVSYDLVDKNTGFIVENAWQKVIKAGESLLLEAKLSWFGTVVSIADQVQSLLKRNGRFSRRLLTEALLSDGLARQFYPLVQSTLELQEGFGATKPRVSDAGSWTLAFWIYLVQDSTSQMRSIFLRGLDYESVRQVSLSIMCF